jgi:hypothetical protein
MSYISNPKNINAFYINGKKIDILGSGFDAPDTGFDAPLSQVTRPKKGTTAIKNSSFSIFDSKEVKRPISKKKLEWLDHIFIEKMINRRVW